MSCILTLQMDAASQALFDALRERCFPPERNHIAAHLTLFHQLPNAEETNAVLAEACRTQPSFPMQVTGLRSLGRGVAYTLASTELLRLHKELSEAFKDDLIPQDRQRFAPHIVVQNKVTGADAKALLSSLQAGFQPWSVEARGLDLWEYLGGPWRHLHNFPFLAQPHLTDSEG